MRLEDNYLIPFLSLSVFRMMTQCSGNLQSNSKVFPIVAEGVCVCVGGMEPVNGVWRI